MHLRLGWAKIGLQNLEEMYGRTDVVRRDSIGYSVRDHNPSGWGPTVSHAQRHTHNADNFHHQAVVEPVPRGQQPIAPNYQRSLSDQGVRPQTVAPSEGLFASCKRNHAHNHTCPPHPSQHSDLTFRNPDHFPFHCRATGGGGLGSSQKIHGMHEMRSTSSGMENDATWNGSGCCLPSPPDHTHAPPPPSGRCPPNKSAVPQGDNLPEQLTIERGWQLPGVGDERLKIGGFSWNGVLPWAGVLNWRAFHGLQFFGSL